MGSYVYVFNLYSEPVTTLTVGGAPAGSIAGYATGAGAPPYTPARLAVSRARYPTGSAAFVLGDNLVQIPWDSFRGLTTVTIPSPGSAPVGLDDPLMLLLAVNQATLLSTRGFVLANFPVSLGMGAASPAADSRAVEPA
ncbi:hypothetical protein [Jatrophihabitans sp.]|uniref:hypothetical protein n=1 Tax=Jatrophihabitans sp. TaxID=1932789 RepID=UPI002BFA8440|nr:hypothetical protein [Jatrophihabitans sp.]